MTFRVGIIGTGDPDGDGFAMAYRHAGGYRRRDDCEIVACADVVPENATAFAAEFDVDDDYVFEDYETMLAAVEPDIVSVTVPPAIHDELVIGTARSGVVEAVHCEKPMADTFAGARRMVETCRQEDVQLTFNRQRRFGRPFTEAKRILEDGTIGDLRRIEIGWGDLFDLGAHTVDLAGMFNADHAAEWVIAQLDYRDEHVKFGLHQENQIWAQWYYVNGVYGVMSTGTGSSFTDAAFVLRGSDGTVRINVEDGPMLQLEQDGRTDAIDVGGETMHNIGSSADRIGSYFHQRAIDDVVSALETGTESVLSGRIGLQTAEILFGGYESARRRGRVDLPPDVDDHPLEELVERGELSPTAADPS